MSRVKRDKDGKILAWIVGCENPMQIFLTKRDAKYWCEQDCRVCKMLAKKCNIEVTT